MHLRVVECGKALLREFELTPARFDILRTLEERERDVPQHVLVELFGVARSTISRMLKGLEHKGFVRRYREIHDQRLKRVVITKSGRKALRKGMKYCVTFTIDGMAASLANGERHVNEATITAHRRLERMTDHFVRARRLLLDKSVVRYPWKYGDYNDLPSFALQHEPLRYYEPGWEDGKPPPTCHADWEIGLMCKRKDFARANALPGMRVDQRR